MYYRYLCILLLKKGRFIRLIFFIWLNPHSTLKVDSVQVVQTKLELRYEWLLSCLFIMSRHFQFEHSRRIRLIGLLVKGLRGGLSTSSLQEIQVVSLFMAKDERVQIFLLSPDDLSADGFRGKKYYSISPVHWIVF